MKRLKRLFMTALLIGFATSAAAEPLALSAALVMGLKHNYDLKVVQLDVTQAEAGMMAQEGRFDVVAELAGGQSEAEVPVASALYSVETFETEAVSGELSLAKQFDIGTQTRLSLKGERVEGGVDALSDQLDPAYNASLVLDLTQPLLKDFGWDANLADLKVAETRKQQAALAYLARAELLVVEIERAYLELLQAGEEYRYYTLARDLARELLQGNERKFEAGLIPVSEVNEARSAMAGREESMLLSEQRVVLARNTLADLLLHGEVVGSQDAWQASFPEKTKKSVSSLEFALAKGLKRRPDLLQARLETEVRQIELAYADNQLWPRLDIEASIGLNGLAGEDAGVGSRYAGDWNDALDGAMQEDGKQWYAGLRLSFPLQNRAARAGYAGAAAADRQALYRLQRAEVSAEHAIRSAWSNLELGERRLEVASRYAALAETTLEQEDRRLSEGLSDTFRVLSFQNALVAARIREVGARIDYHKALSSLYQAMGTNLERYEIVAALPREGVQP
mgnify:CR=1 FL=1